MIRIVMDIMDFIGNMCVVLITIYTFYLTFFSRRIKVVSHGMTTSLFEGDQLHFSLHSYTLQTFEIETISVISQDKCIQFELERPVIVEPRMTVKIFTEKYTRLTEDIDLGDILMHVGWGLILHTRDGIIYAPNRKWDWGMKRKYKYRRHRYHKVSTCKQVYKGMVISDIVKYVIWIVAEGYDAPVFMTENGYMNQMVGGHNALGGIEGLSLKKIRKEIAKLSGVPKKQIFIEDVGIVTGNEPLEVQIIDEDGEDILDGVEIGNIRIER